MFKGVPTVTIPFFFLLRYNISRISTTTLLRMDIAESMIQRFRVGGRNKTKFSPSKEDILNTIEQFGGKTVGVDSSSNGYNNNRINQRIHSNIMDNQDLAKLDFIENAQPLGGSFTHSYSTEWERLFGKPNFLKALRNHGLRGNLRSSRFRSICWKLYLEVLLEDKSNWLIKTREWRQKYDDLKNNLIINPRKAVDSAHDLSLNNPLSQAEESPWNRFFQDNELRLTIKQDVIRTYPRIEFFQSNQVRNMMVDILFIYAKLNVDLSYRQGMHELLAPLIFVLHCDHQAFLHACEIESIGEMIRELMDPMFLEHDAYAMFCQVMATVEPWYTTKDAPTPKGKDIFNVQPFARPQDLNPSNVIITKLTRIQDYILKKYDVELHLHLERLEIVPQIYGIRWVRLLFGREFPMQDLLMLWDAIFSDGIGFDLVDYVFVSMLLYVRDLLLTSDYPNCMNTLMRYPPVGDVHYFVDKALYLREPNQYPKPPAYSYQTVNQAQPSRNKVSTNNNASANKSRSSVMTGFSSLTRKINNRPRTLSVRNSPKKMTKSSSEPMNLQTDISPVTPPCQEKRGSTASLSKVEDTMLRSTPSASSLMPRSVASTPAGYSPDDSHTSSPTRYASLPSKGRMKSKRTTRHEQDINTKMAYVQGKLNEFEAMCKYCASKLDIHIENLQDILHAQTLSVGEDEVLLSIAGVKQVRDILKGTLKFSRNLLDEDKIEITDNHYREEPCILTPDSDVVDSAAAAATHRENELFGRASLYDYKRMSRLKGVYSNDNSPSHMNEITSREVELVSYVPQDQNGAADPVNCVDADTGAYQRTRHSEYGCHSHQYDTNTRTS
ncbi:TBC1 domain family member 5 isoform X7 [Octopus sinensis]|nr:TBC1 domain family member 5 isoform X7 [Octopus sinensis]